MIIQSLLFLFLMMAFLMVLAKRINALIHNFCLQSLALFMLTLIFAVAAGSIELYIVAVLLLIIKVILIPHFLGRIMKKLKVDDNVGFFINPVLSLFAALLLTYLSYVFVARLMPGDLKLQSWAVIISLSVTLIGLFIMVFRMKALTQIIGLLVMENGLFLAASAISGGMPFFVEIAIFFDIFVCVIILGVFVYRINKVFTHVDVNKLSELRG
ncbi:MAG: hydrogenase [Candidatus Omnitrophota bacterium]